MSWRHGAEWGTVAVPIHYWESGFYFARIQNQSGAVRFAPFILRSGAILRSRVAVVLPTNTWQAYNFRDDDGDGVPNTWYADEAVTTVELSRPFLQRGVPLHFRRYELGFIRWLARTGKAPDFLADDDLGRFRTSRGLLARFDLIVFPGHEEYVTEHVYNLVEGFYELGGNLLFLAANNFFRRVVRSGTLITRTEMWRDLGRPEARWIGAQYLDWSQGMYPNRPYLVVGAHSVPWLFRGTGLKNGDRFGVFGIEIDTRTPDSPPGTQLVATIPDIFGPGRSAEMVYHETSAGAKVFAAGAFSLAGPALHHPVRQLLENLWIQLERP